MSGARTGQRSGLYTGVMMHHRTAPSDHVFRYPVCFYVIDLDELETLDRRLKLFGYNRPNLFALRDGDHIGDPTRPVKANIVAWLAERGVDLAGGRVLMLTNLRTFGYVFNPVSFFYCYDPADRFVCAIAEVSNTFGERRPYLLGDDNLVANGRTRTWRQEKELHVSPFFPMEQTYQFMLSEPGERVSTRVDLYQGGERIFVATQSGTRQPLTDAALARTLVRYPLMAQRVTGLIHFEALRLWRKRVPFFRKPAFDIDGGSRHGGDAPSSARPALRELPEPSRLRFPVAPVRAVVDAVLARPAGGSLTVRTPDGRVRTAGEPGAKRSATIDIRSKDLYRRLVTRGRIGIGEAYVAGDWDADELATALEILVHTGERVRRGTVGTRLTRLQALRPHLPRATPLSRAKRHIAYHYDLGNDLYELFLDPTMTYSCAYFEGPDDTLEQAQRNKYRRICEKLDLGPDDHVLEIGCGWGGFAMFAAREFGARVTGVTISERQHELAVRRVREAELDDRVTIRLQDYRTLDAGFTKIASIEMFEAIGEREYPTFFATCDRLLERGGLACIQTIAIPDHRFERYRRTPDWIQEHIFPGSLLPSLESMVAAMARSSELIVRGVEEIGINYAETLRRWRERFTANLDRVRALGYDERFIRTWTFYLAFCEAAFRTRTLHDYQLVFGRALDERLPRYPRVRVSY